MHGCIHCVRESPRRFGPRSLTSKSRVRCLKVNLTVEIQLNEENATIPVHCKNEVGQTACCMQCLPKWDKESECNSLRQRPSAERERKQIVNSESRICRLIIFALKAVALH